MLKLLIADASEEFVLALMDALQGSYQIRSCANGKEVLEILRKEHPDVMVLDLMLPELDGISLLQQANLEGILPVVLATSCFYSPYVIERVQDLGVGYVMRKPCDIRATVERILDMSQQVRLSVVAPVDPRTAVSEMLMYLGIRPQLKGYVCLRESILLMAREAGQSITKEIYPEVGTQLGGSKAQVEHAIRSAVRKAWNKRDGKAWDTYFPPSGDGIAKCPTNKEVICRLADYLELRRKS